MILSGRENEMKKVTEARTRRVILRAVLAVLLFMVLRMSAFATEDDVTGGTATVKAGKKDIRVRATAVDGKEVTKVKGGDSFTIVSSTQGSDGYTWYEISGTVGGANITGFVRSDFVDVTAPEPTETEEPEETDAPPADDGGSTDTSSSDNSGAANTTMGSILAMDPPVDEAGNAQQPPVLPEGFYDTRIRVGDREVQAWTNDTFYIFYATSPSGNVGWYLYDSAEGRWVRYMDFLLNSAATAPAETTEGGGSSVLTIILIVVILVLGVACGFMALKLFGGSRDDDDYVDDDDDDDDYRPVRRQQSSSRQNVSPSRGSSQGVQQRSAAPSRAAQPTNVRTVTPQSASRPAQPQGSGQVVRRQGGSAQPVTRRSPQGGAGRAPQGMQGSRSQGVRQSRPSMNDEDED